TPENLSGGTMGGPPATGTGGRCSRPPPRHQVARGVEPDGAWRSPAADGHEKDRTIASRGQSLPRKPRLLVAPDRAEVVRARVRLDAGDTGVFEQACHELTDHLGPEPLVQPLRVGQELVDAHDT